MMQFGKHVAQRFTADFKVPRSRAVREQHQVFAQRVNDRIEVTLAEAQAVERATVAQRGQFGGIDGTVREKREGNDAGSGFRAVRGIVAHVVSPVVDAGGFRALSG